MEAIEITSLSSRGQIVIPQKIRDSMHLQEGVKFAVIAGGDTIMLKKMEMPSFRDFERLMKSTQAAVKKAGITPADVEKAIKRVRKNEGRTRH